MTRTTAYSARSIRLTLWASVFFNLFAAALLAFPGSAVAQLLEMPADAPLLYRTISALAIGLFGLAYAWMALQHRPDRPLLAFSAIMKSSVFAAAATLWLMELLSVRLVLVTVVDLVFAVIWFWWLFAAQAHDRDRRIAQK